MSEPLGVRVAGLSKGLRQAGGVLPVLDNLTFDVPPGRFISLLGPSGAGKSTLLGILAGLDAPSAGTVTLYGSGGPRTGPLLGQVGYMPQRSLLLPWRSALDNAVVGLEVRGVPQTEARAAALALFREFGLSEFATSPPAALSGGMRQRVSFARSALAARGLLLLDEPFGALDALTRAAMQEWLLGVWERLATTVILVTHDVDEAVLLSDTVYVLTPRPARIAHQVAVTLPRPRLLESTATPEFAERRAELLAALRAAGSLADGTRREVAR